MARPSLPVRVLTLEDRAMRRTILIILLSLGTIGGYAAGVAHLACWRHGGRAAFERHVAQVCVQAARTASESKAPPAP